MSFTAQEYPEGRLEIVPESAGVKRVRVTLDAPHKFLPIAETTTSYSDDLIQTIAKAKGLAWLCDEIIRDESGYVEQKIRANVAGYLDPDQWKTPRILDFGCGCGASLAALARIFPHATITGVELDEKNALAARARADFYGLGSATCLVSPEPGRLPQDIGWFDIINLNSTKLATPTLIGPPTGAIFYHSSPRVVYLEWKPVIGANEYRVWVKYYDQSGILKDLHNSPYLLDGTHLSGFLIHDFPGPYQGIWCVKARDTTGAWLESAPSAWRTFTFKN